MKALSCLLAVVLLAGCATRLDAPEGSRRSGGAEEGLYADLIRGMLAQGQYYAALAHVEEEARRRGDRDELRALRADALAALGRTAEADTLYRSLLRGRLRGEGYHGLGLLYARRDPNAALAWLAAAVREHPTNAEWRNDLGFAYTSAGRYREALPELATATELAPASEKYRNNLAILLILMKDEAALGRLAEQSHYGREKLAELRRQAQTVARRGVAARAPPAPKASKTSARR